MLYSTACEYGIRALTHLAGQGSRDLLRLRDIARAEEIPYPFLAKVFQELVSGGLLRSARGRSGGYALARPASQITLHDVKAAIDGVSDLERCAVGLGRCSDEMPCPQHDSFKPIREQIKRYLRRTTLADMARALARKRVLLAEEEAARKPAGARARAAARSVSGRRA